MSSIHNLYFRNPRLLVLTVGVVVVAGLSAYAVLPRSEDPTLRRTIATITTRFPGASAERIESLVTEKIEDRLREVEEIKRLDSTSRVGISVISVELDDDVNNLEAVWSRVRDKVADVEAELPAGASEPELERQTVTAYTLIVGLTWELESPPQYAILRRVAEDLEDELRSIAGTAEVDLYGDPDEEVRVDVDAAELASRGLTVAEVAEALRRADSKDPAGQLNHVVNDLPIEVSGEVDSVERVMEVPVLIGSAGQMVRVGDIARVRKTIVEPPSDLALLDGKPAIAIAVRAEEGQRTDDWAAAAREVVAQYRARVPRGMSLDLVFDQSRYVEARLNGLTQNLLIAMGLVVGVIFFMMGWRSALIIGAALPLSSLMVLAGMRALGIPMHQMSVTGLIVALGLLIDNAIVMVDEVRQRLRDGLPSADAIARAVRHLAVPLFGSTFTTALAFMPLVLMPGGAGEFVGTIGLSVILAITSSLFLALTVIPALTGLLKRTTAHTGSMFWKEGLSSARLTAVYRGVLDRFVARPALGVAVAVILPVLGFVQAAKLEEQFFPPADRDQFFVEMRLPAHAALHSTEQIVQQARERILAQPHVTNVHWFVGSNAPKFYYNMFGTQDGSAFYAQALVQMESAKNVPQVIREIQRGLDAAFPQAQTVARQIEQGPPFDAPVEIRLYGPDVDVLRGLGEQMRAELAAMPDTVHTRATLGDGRPQLRLRLNEEEARAAGLDNIGIAGSLRGNLSGVVGGALVEATEELPVRVRVAPEGRRDVADVASLDLLARNMTLTNGAAGRQQLPLTALGEFDLAPELSSITRRNGTRVNTVQAFVTAGVLPGKVLNALQTRLKESGFQLPAGYRYEIGGEAAERDDAVGNLFASVGVLAVVMAATLVLTFGSFRLAGMLGVVAGLSVGLSLGALWLFGYPFGFMAIVGTMGLVGVALNDSIVVLAAVREDPAARSGDRGAIRDVVVRATRHVLSTTITTVAGFIPLLVGGGGFWPPLAVAIAGGVVGATFLALFFVPSAYIMLMCRRPVARRAAASAVDSLSAVAAAG